MTTSTMTSKIQEISAAIDNYPVGNDPLARKNPFLHFNETLISLLMPLIDKDSTLTLLYVHDLCKKGYYSNIQRMSTNAGVCFARIEHLITSLRQPDSDIVKIMFYPVLSSFLSGKGRQDLALSMIAEAIEAYKQLDLKGNNLSFNLYLVHAQLLYNRILIRRGEASSAVDNLFSLFYQQIDHHAAAAAIVVLVELNKFALLNDYFNRSYRNFLSDLRADPGEWQHDSADESSFLLTGYLRAAAKIDGPASDQTLDTFKDFLTLKLDDNGIILIIYLFVNIRRTAAPEQQDMNHLTEAFCRFVRKFGLENNMEQRIMALLN
jgi:tetratricopeptide (TPR) repeat protein